MNGVHDMAGMHCMGAVEIEKNEPVFHERWESRVFALRLAAGFHRRWNGDMNRYAVERMPPVAYLAASYYEKVLFGFETLLLEQGVVTAKEMKSGHAAGKANVTGVLTIEGIGKMLENRIRTRRDANVAPKFKVGDRVRARNINPQGHTRLPRYARGRHGVIHRDHGVFVFPDTSAMTRDPKPQHLYTVRFASRELWGPDASAHDSVYLNLWDDHLDPA